MRFIFHFDDIITVGSPGSVECATNMEKISQACQETGVPIESEKSEGPATTLQLELDTGAMEIHLPKAKLEALRSALAEWRGRKACRKLSLIGTLSFAVRAGRTFLRCLSKLSTTVLELYYFVRISLSAQVDIEWWFQYSASWNGVSIMTEVSKCTPAVTLTSDTPGLWGCRAFTGKDWLGRSHSNPTYHKLAPIVIAAAVWGSDWTANTVKVQCDNVGSEYH